MFEVWAKVISIKRSSAWLFTTFICQMSRQWFRDNSAKHEAVAQFYPNRIKDFRLYAFYIT
jgi:hypothetical protein